MEWVKLCMAKPNKIKDNLEMYEQVYFTHDEPVPLKGHLKVYPVLVKDYNCSIFAKTLRMKLWTEHLGITDKDEELIYIFNAT